MELERGGGWGGEGKSDYKDCFRSQKEEEKSKEKKRRRYKKRIPNKKKNQKSKIEKIKYQEKSSINTRTKIEIK